MYKSHIQQANIPLTSNLRQLEDLCMQHDWTYEQSDDHSIWKRGKEQWKAIVEMQDKCLKDGYTREQVLAVIRKYNYS